MILRSGDWQALSSDDWRRLVEGVQDYAIYTLDPRGHVSSWNAGAQNIKGYRAEEVLGTSFARFFTAEDREAGRPERELETARREGRFEEEGFRVRKDGTRFWANVVLTCIRDGQGNLLGFAKVTRDLTARLRADATARELASEQVARAAAEQAEARAAESERKYRALSQRLAVILEGVADGITVQERSGRVVFANTAAARSSGFESVEALLAAEAGSILERFEITDEHGAPIEHARLPGRRALRGETDTSLVMRVRERATGRTWWSEVRAAPVLDDHGQPELAINIWHDVTEQRRRQEHERHAASASAALAESLDYERMLETLGSILVPHFADWCSIRVLEGDELRQVAVSHVDPRKVEFAREVGRRYPLERDQPNGIWEVARTGRPVLMAQIGDDIMARAARDAEHLAILRSIGLRSVMIVPLRAGPRILGTMTIVAAESGRVYDALDLTFAVDLGARAGQAIENARLYAAERRARAELSLLAEAGEVFASAESYEQMLGKVARIALPTLGDFAFFDLEEGAAVRRTAAALDADVEAIIRPTQWVRSERTDMNLCALSSGRSARHAHIDEAWIASVARSEGHAALLRALELTSMITVPLSSRGNLLGALTLCFGRSGRQHTLDDLKLAEELARRAAISVVQMRLFAEARDAATRAEEANRVKDEFLATVSHELRTPLNAVLGWSTLLHSRSSEAPSMRKGLEVIQRNAVAQGRIIDDILDVSRIVTGKLRLDLQAVELGAIVRDAIDVVRPAASARELTVELDAPAEASLVADRDRLQQVVWNLLSNAVKFSLPGGAIRVELAQLGAELRLTVTDTGRGIDPAFLPFVFERFKQEDSSTTRSVGGLGLGLAIVRHLVELHGGTVEARSKGKGAGASFVVTLPARSAASVQVREPRVSERPAARHGAALAGLRVLIVDDEADALELLETALAQAGAVVETATSAADAFAALPRFAPHVLVSDIGMPEEDGHAFLRRVRQLDRARGGAVPAIAVTAYTSETDRLAALAAGFDAHIGKPVKLATLIASIASLAEAARR